MASLLTSAQKAEIQQAFDQIHDTFAREIYIYIETKKATAPPNLNFNPLYGRVKNTSTLPSQKQLTKHTCLARVFYENSQDEGIIDQGGQFNLKFSDGRVRIKVGKTDYEKIKICSRIEIDDNLFILDSDAKHVGPFSSEYYMVYLKREN